MIYGKSLQMQSPDATQDSVLARYLFRRIFNPTVEFGMDSPLHERLLSMRLLVKSHMA